jgi:hypothetical protein
MNTDKQKTRKDKGVGFGFIRVHPCSSVAINSYQAADNLCLLRYIQQCRQALASFSKTA